MYITLAIFVFVLNFVFDFLHKVAEAAAENHKKRVIESGGVYEVFSDPRTHFAIIFAWLSGFALMTFGFLLAVIYFEI